MGNCLRGSPRRKFKRIAEEIGWYSLIRGPERRGFFYFPRGCETARVCERMRRMLELVYWKREATTFGGMSSEDERVDEGRYEGC